MRIEPSEAQPSQSTLPRLTFPPSKTFLGLRISALVEISIFFMVAVAIDLNLGQADRFRGVDPHPYWIIILLMSCQYGRWEGLLATFLSALFYLSENFDRQVFGENLFDRIDAISYLPTFWLVTAIVLGELRLRHIRDRNFLRKSLIEAQEREEAITQAFVRMHRVKDRLETQVAGQTETMISYFKMAQIMEGHDTESILKGARELIRMVLDPKSFSIFLLQREGLEVLIRDGWEEDAEYSIAFEPHSPLFRAVIGNQKTLVVARAEDRGILMDEGIMASPLISLKSGNVIGMLKVERLEFAELNTSSVENFKLLCEWIGIAYDKAVRLHRAQTEQMVNEDHKLYSKGFLSRQMEVFRLLGRRLAFDVILLIITLDNPDDLSEQESALLPGVIGETLTRAMRKTDMVFDYDGSGIRFALFMPATDPEQLPRLEEKVGGILKQRITWVAPLATFSMNAQIIRHTEGERSERG
ncbi:MAG: hypothetical protein HW380_1867 [Magnetococcales bacterium]|nr:hypothetical protein [Magnetococcales bacterium]